MIRTQLGLHVLAIVIATSYLTLGIAEPDTAGSLWAVYALVTFVLAAINLMIEQRRREERDGR